MFWCCALPLIIVYGVLVALLTRWNAALVSVIPSLLAGAVVAILMLSTQPGGFMVGETVVATGPVGTAGVFFLITFGTWFIVIGSVVALTRLIRRNLKGEHHE